MQKKKAWACHSRARTHTTHSKSKKKVATKGQYNSGHRAANELAFVLQDRPLLALAAQKKSGQMKRCKKVNTKLVSVGPLKKQLFLMGIFWQHRERAREQVLTRSDVWETGPGRR